jgi:hypothetical protein
MYFVIALCFHRGEDKVGILGNSINALPIFGQTAKNLDDNFKFRHFGALCGAQRTRLNINPKCAHIL